MKQEVSTETDNKPWWSISVAKGHSPMRIKKVLDKIVQELLAGLSDLMSRYVAVSWGVASNQLHLQLSLNGYKYSRWNDMTKPLIK